MHFSEWLHRLFYGTSRRLYEQEEADCGFEGEDEVDPFNPFPEPVEIEIGDIFDLHTVAPRDVGRVVAEYLREAHRAGFRTVRLIHGKGKGVQRERVRRILARTSFVERWTDAPQEAGGWGATIVYLLPPEAMPQRGAK
jgi:hypothetical protein